MWNKKIAVVITALLTIVICIGCGSHQQATDSFGLKDFEGFYYNTSTENMDGYDLTTTYGMKLNGDGTGTYYGQDTVEITWNETEIHFGESVMNYEMTPGKLTVHDGNVDVEYEKLSGNFITPNPLKVNVNEIEDGIYPADVNQNGISEENGELFVTADIFTEDTYDIVDIGQMTEGDIILVDGCLFEITSVETTGNGSKEINGGLEEGGTSLRALEESNCFVFFGMDDMGSYSLQGTGKFQVGPKAQLIDRGDPAEEKIYSGNEIKDRLEVLLADPSLNRYNCRIRVENGMIVEIEKNYVP